MPTIEVLFEDLQRLVGRRLPRDKEALTELLAYVKGEVESLEGDELFIELKDGNRPDLWSAEGIARELRGALGIESGLRPYEVKGSSGVEILVDPRLQTIRPYIGCSVVKSVRVDDEVIRELMHLQDKLDQTYGRKRRRTSIGFYRYELIRPPLHYKASTPTEYCFVPLESSEAMTLEEILEHHPKGVEYGAIVRDFPLWPMLVDDRDQVLSFPPIINSNSLGRITEGDQDILVEVTGTRYQTVLNTLTIVTLSLADRGREILSAKILYPYGPIKEDVTPRLETKRTHIDQREADRLLGLKLESHQIAELLRRARYDAQVKNGVIEVTVPCYRVDIMNSVDVIEDVAIAYGFNNISPVWPRIATTGAMSRLEECSDLVREVMVGLGFQEILTFSLTDRESQQEKMGVASLQLVEVANPSSLHFTHLRGWLLPSLMAFLANNTHALYPQKIFEVGDCTTFDPQTPTGVRDVRKLAAVIAHSTANFSELKAVVEAFFRGLGLKPELEESGHPSFLAGRVGDLLLNGRRVGVAGEVAPGVLDAWGLGNPAVGFEVNLATIFEELP
jgi:phenylalanyl-tRNA synthetase beta chain